MQIKDPVTNEMRECCNIQTDLKIYRSEMLDNSPLKGKRLFFCKYCGQVWTINNDNQLWWEKIKI